MNFSGITLVTGAAGFMGRHLVEHLAASGVQVRATARPKKDTSFFDNLGVEFVAADLTKPETLPPLFEGKVDRIFHMGAICNFSTPYSKLFPTNVEGVKRITELSLKKGVKRYVHVGSTSVYGYSYGKPLSEDTQRNPADSYGRSKRDGEDVVWRMIEQGLPAIITRPCTVYGPGCNDGAGKAFSRPTKIAAIPGTGRQKLSNVRAEDVATAVDHLSRLDGVTGEAYNIADDTNPTLGEALILAAEVFGVAAPAIKLPLTVVKTIALVDGFISARRGKIPELEYDAVKYLYHDYIVTNDKIKNTGFEFTYSDFYQSLRQLGELYGK